VGWRDRDYGKFTDDERRALYGDGGPSVPPAASWKPIRNQPPAYTLRRRVARWTLALLAIAGIVTVATPYLANRTRAEANHAAPLQRPLGGTAWAIDPTTPITALPSIPVIDPGGTITIVWRYVDLVPAQRAGSVCVVADGPGKICTSFRIGERPADVLAGQVRSLGYPVEHQPGS
jgi:hypothetical protein